jgi:hypothetical protein
LDPRIGPKRRFLGERHHIVDCGKLVAQVCGSRFGGANNRGGLSGCVLVSVDCFLRRDVFGWRVVHFLGCAAINEGLSRSHCGCQRLTLDEALEDFAVCLERAQEGRNRG